MYFANVNSFSLRAPLEGARFLSPCSSAWGGKGRVPEPWVWGPGCVFHCLLGAPRHALFWLGPGLLRFLARRKPSTQAVAKLSLN